MSAAFPAAAHAQRLDRTGTLWAPYLEWSLPNPSYSGNPFDLVASTTFVHSASGEIRTTPLFYAGGDEWRFRFSATRTGAWTFTTSSDDPELHGHQGTVTIAPNPEPTITGFLTSSGNKFARQVGENGELTAFIYNVYQDNVNYGSDFWDWENDRSLDYIRTYPAEQWAMEYLAAAREHGADTIFIALANQWLQEGALAYDDHSSQNPELLTFEMLERVITTVHSQGGHLQIWMWGDDARSRRWTPTGLDGGINGVVDRRLQRYIAARLGPLPGWSMGYGFDLDEWVSEEQTQDWASYLHQHMGWEHLLWARDRSNAKLDAISYNGEGPDSFADALAKMSSDSGRPHLEEERFYHQRWDKYDMDTTRRHFWWYTLAGGMGGHWGFHRSYGDEPYSHPEQLAAHRLFWKDRFLLDMSPANHLTDGYALKDQTSARYVFYKEDTASVRLDLSDMSGSQMAVAVDTKRAYEEVEIGILRPISQTWTAPYSSDWAIAVGSFGGAPPPDQVPPRLTAVTLLRSEPSVVQLSFSEPLEQSSAVMISNYSIDKGIEVIRATLSNDGRTVALETTEHRGNTQYTLVLSNIRDRASPPNTLVAGYSASYGMTGGDRRIPSLSTWSIIAAASLVLIGAWLWLHKRSGSVP
jgi:hypothetical protein